MEYKKYFLALGLIALVVGGIFYFFFRPQKDISGLLTHLNEAGLQATRYTEPLSPLDAQVVAGAREEIGKIQQASGNIVVPIDAQDLKINDIVVKVMQYKTVEDAQKIYALQLRLEKAGREYDTAHRLPHPGSDFYINDTFLMRIDHYQTRLVNGKVNFGPLGMQKLELDAPTLLTIANAFGSY
jgi:hypothetical protein